MSSSWPVQTTSQLQRLSDSQCMDDHDSCGEQLQVEHPDYEAAQLLVSEGLQARQDDREDKVEEGEGCHCPGNSSKGVKLVTIYLYPTVGHGQGEDDLHDHHHA